MGIQPNAWLAEQMDAYNEELVRAGVRLAAEGAGVPRGRDVLFGRCENAAEQPDESVTVQFRAGGTMTTMLLFRSQNAKSPRAASTPQIASVRAFGRVFELRPVQQKSE